MAKRIYWETMKSYALKAGVPVGIAGFALLFWYLSLIGAITITGFSGDEICSGTSLEPCEAIINFTANEDVFLYPTDYDPYGRNSSFKVDKEIESWKIYRTWGNGWREIKLTETCTGTWCGAPNNRGVGYSFVFREDRDYTIKLEVIKKNESDSIKWDFFNLDPYFYGVNNSYKVYDENEREFFIKDNTYDTTIFSGKLISEQNVKVGVGYQQVAEFEINSSVYLNKFIDKIELHDLVKDKKIERKIDVKYKDYEDIIIYEYETLCGLAINGSKIEECERFIIGNHTEKKIIWKELNNSIDVGMKTIGLFTNVEIGDKVEWIPTISKVRISEWAAWTAELETNIVSWYRLNETSGVVLDALTNGTNATNNGTTRGVAGIINGSFQFDGVNDHVNMSDDSIPSDIVNQTTGSISFWLKPNNITVRQTIMAETTPSGTAQYIQIYLNTANTIEWVRDGLALYLAPANFSVGTWKHIVLTSDGTTFNFYLNGSLVTKQISAGTDGGWFHNVSGTTWFGFGELFRSTHVQFLNGTLDEIGFWNRTLNSSEVTLLYNDGSGCTFQLCDVNLPTITLNSPSNNTYQTIQSVTFNGTISNIEPLNVSLIIDGTINETNTSGVLGDYIFTKNLNEGNHTWTYEACVEVDCADNPGNRTIVIDLTDPSVSYNPTTDNDGVYYSRDWIFVNISATDTNLNSVRMEFDGTNETFASNEGDNYWENKTSLTDGAYSFYGWANDTSGRIGTTATRTVNVDTLGPNIDFIDPTPANNTLNISSNNFIFINISITEINPKNITYRLHYSNNTLINSTTYLMATNTSNTTINFSNLDDESYLFNVTIFDQANNSNSTETRLYHIVTFNIFFDGFSGNNTAELGELNLIANSTASALTVCVDIIHPDFGINHSCEVNNTDLNFTLNYFNKTSFSDDSESKVYNFSDENITNLTFTGHQYDEIDNFTINISGLNNPRDVLIFHANTTPDISNQTQYEPLIDRFFDGELIGDEVYVSEFFDNVNTINLTYGTGGEQLVYFLLDDILQTKTDYTFFLNVSGFLFGFDFTDGNTTSPSEGFDNYSNIDTALTTTQLDVSGIIMAKNVSKDSYIYDTFTTGPLNTLLWLNSSCDSDVSIPNTYSRCINASENTLRSEVSSTGYVSGVVTEVFSINLSRWETDRINFTISSNYTGQEDSGEKAAATSVIKYDNTILWNMTILDSNTDDSETNNNLIEFRLSKHNRTHWQVERIGTENATAVQSGPDQELFLVYDDTSFFQITNSDELYIKTEATCSCTGSRISRYSMATFNLNETLWTRENSSVISKSIYDTTSNIDKATIWANGVTAGGESNSPFLSADNGVTWESVTFGSEHTFTTDGKNLKFKIDFNQTASADLNFSSYITKINVSVPSGAPTNLSFDFGNDGVVDATLEGVINATNGTLQVNLSVVNISSAFNNSNRWSSVITHVHVYKIPVSITSASRGILTVDVINLTYNPNPIFINTTNISRTLNSSTNFSTYRIPLGAFNNTGTPANVTVDGINLKYAGGNKTIQFIVHDSSYSLNLTANVTYYYSRWEHLVVPNNIEFIEFIPSNSTAKNVTPFGQNNLTPILNLTNLGYGGKNANWSLYVNDTNACISLTLSNTNNKSTGYTVGEYWTEFQNNTNFLSNTSVYLWADYTCTPQSSWTTFNPFLLFRQCVLGGLCSTELT